MGSALTGLTPRVFVSTLASFMVRAAAAAYEVLSGSARSKLLGQRVNDSQATDRCIVSGTSMLRETISSSGCHLADSHVNHRIASVLSRLFAYFAACSMRLVMSRGWSDMSPGRKDERSRRNPNGGAVIGGDPCRPKITERPRKLLIRLIMAGQLVGHRYFFVCFRLNQSAAGCAGHLSMNSYMYSKLETKSIYSSLQQQH